MRGHKASKARFMGDTVDPNIRGAHFEFGIVWPDLQGDFLKALGLHFENDNQHAVDSLKQLLIDVLTEVPEYLHHRITVWRRKAGKISRARASELSAKEKQATEPNVLRLALSSDPEAVRLVHDDYYDLSEEERSTITQDHLWARIIHKFHLVFTANSASRNYNNAQLRSDLPSPWHTFRLRSNDFQQFKEKYDTVGDYSGDMTDSDRYWKLLYKLVIFLNRQFKDNAIFQIGEGIEFDGDRISKLEDNSKLGPFQQAFNDFVATSLIAHSNHQEAQPNTHEEQGVDCVDDRRAKDEVQVPECGGHNREIEELREHIEVLQQRCAELPAATDQLGEENNMLCQRHEEVGDEKGGLKQTCKDFRSFQQQSRAGDEALQKMRLTQDRQQLEEDRAALQHDKDSLAQRKQQLEEEHAQRSQQLEEEHAARMELVSTIQAKVDALFAELNFPTPHIARPFPGSEAPSEDDGNVVSSVALTPENFKEEGNSPMRGIKRSASDAGASPIPERLQRTRQSAPSPAPSEEDSKPVLADTCYTTD
ncbi:hypothetical protein CKM354_000783400 [Cercospora kikuchii]|uniref:Uncharacterized protein n=1 Tax=Cercospora kikuchii TaxID=84275 RepID=A0A9P3FHU0_9PEZI|nr:uncharacterized protein CKM354_000783400 [Cercospora kikuchii]GIZ44642.1 hypothetical protein CKM354_000783400 [Cercospora kikuchii]